MVRQWHNSNDGVLQQIPSFARNLRFSEKGDFRSLLPLLLLQVRMYSRLMQVTS